MKNQFLLLALFLFFSCGNLLQKNESVITYGFLNEENVTSETKKVTVEVIKNRIQKFTRYVDVSINSKNEILVKLKTNFSLERLNAIVLNQGKIDFWLCYTQEDIWPFIVDANEAGSNDTIKDPLNGILQGVSDNGLFHILKSDIAVWNAYFNKPEIKLLFTQDYKDLKFLFGQSTDEYVAVYTVRSNEKGRAIINETSILEVRQDYDQINRPAISITMNEFGAYNWTKLTNDAYQTNAKIAITINDVVYSAPTVSGGAITGGNSQISGDFTIEEAQNLSYILSSQKSIPKLKFLNLVEIEN